MRVAAPEALIGITISEAHWEAAGFRAKFDSLAERIRGFELKPVRVYGEAATHKHADDIGYVALFHKA